MTDKPLVALLVEDEALVRAMALDTVLGAGLDAVEAQTGDEALRLIDEGLCLDLLITDVRMPGRVDGIALARSARERWPDLPVVVVSGFHAYSNEESGLNGTAEYLAKPYTTQQLEAAIRRALGSKASLDGTPGARQELPR